MIRSAAIAALLALSSTATAASPGYLTVSATAGYDDPVRTPWAGVKLALRPDNLGGFGFIGSVTPAWGFAKEGPDERAGAMGFAEFGIVHFIKAERAVVRLGFVARTGLISVPYRVAVELGRKNDHRLGLTPAGLFHVEFQYGETNPFTFGIRAGMGTGLTNFRCSDPNVLTDCALWTESVIAAAFGNLRMDNGLFLELMFGHTSELSVGYRF